MTKAQKQAKAKKLREAATDLDTKVKEAKKAKSPELKKLEAKLKKALKEAKQAEDECKQSEDEGETESETENENESEDEGESETESEDDDGGGDDDAGHDDADKDKALIAKMLKQYLGGDNVDKMSPKEREECEGLAGRALKAHREMGKEDEGEGGAIHHAGEAVKMAVHLAKQKQSEESEDDGDDSGDDAGDGKKPPKKAPPQGGDDDDDDGDASESEDEGETKESLRKTVKDLQTKLLEAQGRVAALEGAAEKSELNVYVDGKLKESGLSKSVTKRFRETAGKFKSKADFDTKWKIFSEGVRGVSPTLDFSGIMQEKGAAAEGGRKPGSGAALDFSDVVND